MILRIETDKNTQKYVSFNLRDIQFFVDDFIYTELKNEKRKRIVFNIEPSSYTSVLFYRNHILYHFLPYRYNRARIHVITIK